MKRPWVHMSSPSRSPLPPPSPPAPSRSSQRTRSERLSHASNLGLISMFTTILWLFLEVARSNFSKSEPSSFPPNLFHPTSCPCQKCPLQLHFFLNFSLLIYSSLSSTLTFPTFNSLVSRSSTLYSVWHFPWTQNLIIASHAQNTLIIIVIIQFLGHPLYVALSSLPYIN